MSAATSAISWPAMFAGKDCTKGMPTFMCAMCIVAAASLTIIRTDVLASVSLLALAHSLNLVLALIGLLLTLSCLTRQGSLVGLIEGLDLKAGD